MEWFRLYVEFATDPKVQMMNEAMQRRLLMLFCLQCSNGIETFHETERETSIAFALRISDEELAETKELFLRKGFVNPDWTLRNWSKRQYVSDSSTARVRKHRDAKKQEKQNSETLPKRSSNAIEQNRTDTEYKETTLSGKPDDETQIAESPDTAQAKEAIQYLNKKTNSDYRLVKSNLNPVKAKFAEGYTLDDVKAVIDRQVERWGRDEKMQEFLRPKTLFAPSNFSNYAGRIKRTGENWWEAAGFASRFDAENAGCNEHTTSHFHEGKRMEATA